MERIQLSSTLREGGSALESLVLQASRLSSALLIQGALAGCVPESNKPSVRVSPIEVENSDTKINVDLPLEAAEAEEKLMLKPISAGIPPEEVALGINPLPQPSPRRGTAPSPRTSLVSRPTPAAAAAPQPIASEGRVNQNEVKNFFEVALAGGEPECWIPPSSNLRAGSGFDLNLHIANPSGRKLKVEINTVPPIGLGHELTVETRQTSSVVNFNIPASQTGHIDFVVSDKKDTLNCSRRFAVGSAGR